jgi:aryl-alcohol dehydrogenase-like predicted oxidoreductase
MTFHRPVPGTNLTVSALGLGTVKLGRDQSVKYPQSFTIPDDIQVRHLLAQAKESGVNLIDTAPAYGNSEERLGILLDNRQDWVIATKTGEEFSEGNSHFDFSAQHTRTSIERSLKRLQTDYLDIVLIHSDGNDLDILERTDCINTLRSCQEEGKIRAIGMSTKTIEGGIKAASLLDIVMITYNLEQQDQAVLDFAQENNKGVLVKKGLMSGHANSVKESMELLFGNNAKFSVSGIHSVIVGTINPDHLAQNIALAKELID